MLCLGRKWALIVDGGVCSCGRGVDESCLHRCNSWSFGFSRLWIQVCVVSTEGGCAVGKDTKILMNLRARSACRASAIKKGKTDLKTKCVDAE